MAPPSGPDRHHADHHRLVLSVPQWRDFAADEALLGEVLREVIALAEGPEAVALLDGPSRSAARRGGDEAAADRLAGAGRASSSLDAPRFSSAR